MGASALFYGLMAGMPEYLAERGIDMGESTSPAELERLLPYQHVLTNVGRACVDGLQSHIRWFGPPGGKRVDLYTLVREELLPVARKGLASLGVSPADIARYLGVIERRVEGRIADMRGVTPADVIRTMYFTGENPPLSLTPKENCRRISRWLGQILEPKDGELQGIYDIYAASQASVYPA